MPGLEPSSAAGWRYLGIALGLRYPLDLELAGRDGAEILRHARIGGVEHLPVAREHLLASRVVVWQQEARIRPQGGDTRGDRALGEALAV